MIITCPGCDSRYDVSGRKAGTRARCKCGTILRVPKIDATAATLSCPSCGAPCAPDGSECSYCHAALAVVACPACYGRVFAGSAHCSHCGVEVSVHAVDVHAPSDRTCPRCGNGAKGLVAHLVSDTLLDECGTCGGVWLDARAFDRLLKSRDEQAALAEAGHPELTLEAYSKASPDSQTPRYLPCPDCGHLMNRKNFAGVSGVIVDVCKADGVWFDRDELGRIVEFISKGGMETAKRRELERLEQNLKSKREQIAAWDTSAGLAPRVSETGGMGDLLDALGSFLRRL